MNEADPIIFKTTERQELYRAAKDEVLFIEVNGQPLAGPLRLKAGDTIVCTWGIPTSALTIGAEE